MNDPQRFVVLGAGGHGKVVADAIRASGDIVAGFVDIDPDKIGEVVEPGGSKVVCSQDGFLRKVEAGRMSEIGDAVALAVGNNQVRFDLLKCFAADQMPAVVHPSAVVSPSAQLGPGTVVFAGAVINAAAVVGSGVIVNSAAIIEHDCRIGDATHLSPNAAVCGGSSVGERSWVGAGSTIIHQIHVGDDVVVGAGAVVIGDVADGQKVVGNPARSIT